VLCAVAQFILVPFPLSLLVGVLLLCLGIGVLRKRRYGFVLVYVVAGIVLLAGLIRLAIEPGEDAISQFVMTVGFWGIPAAFYYPKRYREFGFGKPQQEQKPVAAVVQPESPVIQRRTLTDEEREMVLDRIHKRSKQQEPMQ